MAKPDHDTIMRLIRQHFGPELQKAVTITRWKDGIDVDYSTYAIEAFFDAAFEIGISAGVRSYRFTSIGLGRNRHG